MLARAAYETYEAVFGMVIYSKNWGSCIPIDSVKSGDDYPNLVHNMRIGHILIQTRPI